MRKYTLNEDFFEKIDSEEKAYWLGFVSADGCVTDRHLIVVLARRDRDHLQKLLDALESNYKIVDKLGGKGNMESWITVCSVKMIRDLNVLGVTRAKSKTLKPWTGPEDLITHYWRGMLDGDGSIEMPYGKYNWWQSSLVGSEFCVKEFASFAQKICGSNAKPSNRGGYWRWIVSGTKMCRKLIEAIYGDANVALERKQQLANLLIGQPMAQAVALP